MTLAKGLSSDAQSVSLADYASDLVEIGVKIVPGGPDAFWAVFESGGMIRIPIFHLARPSPNEIRRVLWRGHRALATYIVEPDERHPANSWLYVCTNQAYSLDTLGPAMRRNVRRGLKELTIAPITVDQLLMHGVRAYCDTRRRVGLSDGTSDSFYRYVRRRAPLPEVGFIGAWKDDQLAAFLSVTEVEDWAELECSSSDALLHYRPNDTLIYSALTHYLVKRRFRMVSYGLSSVQAESNAAGLHRFKTKVGFEARPVHRAFVPHPVLRPVINRLTLSGVNAILRRRPGDRRLKKADGVLACMLGRQTATHVAATE